MIKKNLEKWTCDRCGKNVIYDPQAEEFTGWYTIRHVDENDVLTSKLICDECYTDYKDFVQAYDKIFAEFMNNKK